MENKDQLAFPVHSLKKEPACLGNDYYLAANGGLTKREYFASMAMQGWISSANHNEYISPKAIAEYSIEFADELLKQLSDEKRLEGQNNNVNQ